MAEDPEKRLEYEALIYDCMALSKELPAKYQGSGVELVGQGWIIDINGELSSWSYVRTSSETESKFCVELPKEYKTAGSNSCWTKSTTLGKALDMSGPFNNPKGNLHITA